MRKRLDWHERLTFGYARGREATEADNDAFSDLMANLPKDVGDWEITTERGPNAFAQFRLLTPIEQLPKLVDLMSSYEPVIEPRTLAYDGWDEGGIEISVTVKRPYTDLAYW